MILPLVATVYSGVTYRLSGNWGKLSLDHIHWLMAIHEVDWLSSQIKTLFVLLNPIGVIWMANARSS